MRVGVRTRAGRWLALWMVAVLVGAVGLPTVAPVPGRAQYTDGLPAGLRDVTVDGQPIDASTTPEVGTTEPEFAGRLTRGGATTLELGLGSEAGETIRFEVEITADSGRFRGTAPDPLEAGRYALYVNDALVGEFVVTGEESGTPQARRGGPRPLDLALIPPFPIELQSVAPDLGLVNARYYSVDEQARQTAESAGDASREAVNAAADQLAAAGWRQRFESVLAVPQADDATRFEVQLTGNVIEYADAEIAGQAFEFATNGGEPIEADTIGDASQLSSISGVASETGAAYRGLRLVFRQDRVLVDLRYADLLNREVDQDTFVALGVAVQGRAEAVLGEGFQGLSPKALRLDLGAAAAAPSIRESYEVVGGSTIRLYGEEATALEARSESYAGAENAYGGVASATVAGGGAGAGGRRAGRQATPAAATATGEAIPIAYSVALFGFADEGEAEGWLAGLDARLEGAQLPGILSIAAVAEAPTFGDGSATYELNRQIGDGTGGGFRVYVRIGAEIAAVELAAVGEVPPAAVEELVNQQVECLQRGACQGEANVPAGVGGEGGREG